MGIRKEIKAVLREMDVRDPRLALEAIQKIVARQKATKSPRLIVTDGGVEAKGVKLEDAPKLLEKALAMTKAALAAAPKDPDCKNCPNREVCPDAE